MTDDLTGLGPQGFERLCQALATYVLGPGIEVFGPGPDGGREAAFAGLQDYPAKDASWTGYGVLQAKFKSRLLGTGADTTWLRKQVKTELTAWADPESRRVRDGRLPEYLIVATNVPLSAVPRAGGKDRIGSLIAEFAPAIGLKDWRIWDSVQLGTFLDAHPDVRRAFAALITPSDVLAQLRDKLAAPAEVSVVTMPPPVIKPGQPGNEQAFIPAFQAAGGATRLGQPLGEVQDDGTGFVQYFDGGSAGEPAVICAAYGKVPVAVAAEIWNVVQAVGAGGPGGGTSGAGIPLTASPPATFIDRSSDYVQLAGGRWGPGRLVRAGAGGWVWQPEISFDSEAFRDRDTWAGRDTGMDLLLRVAARIPVVAAGLRVTTAGRARMLEALNASNFYALINQVAVQRGLDAGLLAWAETPEPTGRNHSRTACYQTAAAGLDGRTAVSAQLWFTLPAGVADDIRAIADLRISFDALRPAAAPPADSLAQIPADLQVTSNELAGFLAQGWYVATAVLPLCATAHLADLSPAGPPHLELYAANERRPNTGQRREVRTLDMIDLSAYGQPRQDPPGDLSVGVTAPIGLPQLPTRCTWPPSSASAPALGYATLRLPALARCLSCPSATMNQPGEGIYRDTRDEHEHAATGGPGSAFQGEPDRLPPLLRGVPVQMLPLGIHDRTAADPPAQDRPIQHRTRFERRITGQHLPGAAGERRRLMAKVRYREGDWFAVPLRDGGFGVGLIARANPGGVLLGYFFGPARPGVPALGEVADLRPGDAVLVRKFGHLGIVQGQWPLVGRLDGWDRREWPTPVFVRYEELTGRSYRVFYDDDDPNRVLREERVAPGEAEQAPKDGLMGPGFAEGALTRLLT